MLKVRVTNEDERPRLWNIEPLGISMVLSSRLRQCWGFMLPGPVVA